jgi:glycosyltransferase involved in cell wall biosynthesis
MQWSMLLTRLTADPSWAKQLGEQNRERVRRQFSIEAMVRQYERLFSGCAHAS